MVMAVLQTPKVRFTGATGENMLDSSDTARSVHLKGIVHKLQHVELARCWLKEMQLSFFTFGVLETAFSNRFKLSMHIILSTGITRMLQVQFTSYSAARRVEEATRSEGRLLQEDKRPVLEWPLRIAFNLLVYQIINVVIVADLMNTSTVAFTPSRSLV